MFKEHSLTGRLAISVGVGLVFGGIIFFLLPVMAGAAVAMSFRLGLLLLYVVMSMFIGLMGTYTRHPIFGFTMNFWIRGVVIGIIFHTLLVLLAYSQLELIMQAPFIASFGLSSPWWILVDGMLYATIISWAGTRFAGEGPLPVS